MTFLYPDARTWASDHSLANVPRLARLEGIAFQEHPQIVQAFGADGAAMAERTQRTRRPTPVARTGRLLLALVLIACAIAPALGVAIYGTLPPHLAPTAEGLDASVAVPISSISFMVAALTQLVLWVVWLRGGARWSPMILGIAAYTAVMAGFASIGLPNRSATHGFTEVDRWMWPVWLTLLLSVSLVLAVLVRRKAHPDPVEEPPLPTPPTLSDRERARVAVRALPPEEQSRIRSDRDGALHILAERGLIGDEVLTEALRSDLGTLFTLDPLRKEHP